MPSGHELVYSLVSLNHPYLKKMKITLGMNKAVIVGPPRLIYSPAYKNFIIVAREDAFKKTRHLMDR